MSSPVLRDMRSSQQRYEEVAGQRLPLGGINGFAGVRDKQGRKKNQFQGITPKKQHRTKLFGTARDAAIQVYVVRIPVAGSTSFLARLLRFSRTFTEQK